MMGKGTAGSGGGVENGEGRWNSNPRIVYFSRSCDRIYDICLRWKGVCASVANRRGLPDCSAEF